MALSSSSSSTPTDYQPPSKRSKVNDDDEYLPSSASTTTTDEDNISTEPPTSSSECSPVELTNTSTQSSSSSELDVTIDEPPTTQSGGTTSDDEPLSPTDSVVSRFSVEYTPTTPQTQEYTPSSPPDCSPSLLEDDDYPRTSTQISNALTQICPVSSTQAFAQDPCELNDNEAAALDALENAAAVVGALENAVVEESMDSFLCTQEVAVLDALERENSEEIVPASELNGEDANDAFNDDDDSLLGRVELPEVSGGSNRSSGCSSLVLDENECAALEKLENECKVPATQKTFQSSDDSMLARVDLGGAVSGPSGERSTTQTTFQSTDDSILARVDLREQVPPEQPPSTQRTKVPATQKTFQSTDDSILARVDLDGVREQDPPPPSTQKTFKSTDDSILARVDIPVASGPTQKTFQSSDDSMLARVELQRTPSQCSSICESDMEAINLLEQQAGSSNPNQDDSPATFNSADDSLLGRISLPTPKDPVPEEVFTQRGDQLLAQVDLGGGRAPSPVANFHISFGEVDDDDNLLALLDMPESSGAVQPEDTPSENTFGDDDEDEDLCKIADDLERSVNEEGDD